jgi:hypothetical protein
LRVLSQDSATEGLRRCYGPLSLTDASSVKNPITHLATGVVDAGDVNYSLILAEGVREVAEVCNRCVPPTRGRNQDKTIAVAENTYVVAECASLEWEGERAKKCERGHAHTCETHQHMSNVRITCELVPARPWQPRVMVLPSMLLCQGRDGPARQVNAPVSEPRIGGCIQG